VIAELTIEVKPKAPKDPERKAIPIAQAGVTQAAVDSGEAAQLVVWLANSGDTARVLSLGAPEARFVRKAHGHSLSASPTVALGTTSVKIAPHGSAPLTLKVTGLNQPGEYSGDLAIDAGAGALPIAATVTIAVRRSIWWLIAASALGVILTQLGSWIRDWIRPRREHRVALAQIVEHIAAIGETSDKVATARRRVRVEASRIANQIGTGKPDQVKALIDALSQRVDLLAAASANLAAVAELSSLATQAAKRKVVDHVLAIVVGDSRDTVTDGFKKLDELGIAADRRAELGQALNDLDRSMDEHHHSTDRALVVAIDRTVEPALLAAHAARRADDLVSLQHELGVAQAALVEAGTRSIRAALEHKPAWIPDDAWDRIRTTVTGVLNASRPGSSAAAGYEAMRDAFVTSVADEVLAIATAKVAATRSPDPVLNAAILRLQGAGVDRATRAAATRALQDLLARATGKPDDVVPTAFSGQRAAIQVLSVEAAFPLPEMPATTPAPLGLAHNLGAVAVAWKAIATGKWVTDGTLMLIALVIALVGGVKLLWIDNATWGTWSDLIAAFLWGTGVKLTADAFGGLTWLRRAIGTLQ
jgi:hypothetical protein